MESIRVAGSRPLLPLFHAVSRRVSGHEDMGLENVARDDAWSAELLEIDRAHASPIDLNPDLCVRVKVTPTATLPG